MRLRPYQAKAMAEVDAAFECHRCVLLQMPTGAGKTVCFVHNAADPDERVAIVAHRKTLIRQAHAKAVAHGLDATFYPSAEPGRVTVGSIQTFANRIDRLPRFDRIILDECHHAVSPTFARFLDSQPQAKVFGVTATPQRLDGRGLGSVFSHMVVGPSIKDLLAMDPPAIVPTRAYGRPPVDMQGVRTITGDFNTADLEQVMARPSLLGDGPAHYERLAAWRPALVFCVSVKHAQESAAAFRAEGWRFEAIHGQMDDRRQAELLEALEVGRLHGLCSCDLISEGLDITNVGCVIMQRPTQSLIVYMQAVGRGFRLADGKRDLVLLDQAGNVLRHGMPDADRTWSLDAPKRRASDTPAVAQCPTCFALHSPGPVCPLCGHDYVGERAEAEARRLEQEAGELALLTEDDRRIRTLRTTPLGDLLKLAKTHEHLAEIGRARGFHAGWADVRSRFLPAHTDGAEFLV